MSKINGYRVYRQKLPTTRLFIVVELSCSDDNVVCPDYAVVRLSGVDIGKMRAHQLALEGFGAVSANHDLGELYHDCDLFNQGDEDHKFTRAPDQTDGKLGPELTTINNAVLRLWRTGGGVYLHGNTHDEDKESIFGDFPELDELEENLFDQHGRLMEPPAAILHHGEPA